MANPSIKELEERLKERVDEKAIRILHDHYTKRKDYDALKRMYLKVLEHDPNHVYAMRQLARLFANRFQDYKTAESYYHRILEVQPGDPLAHYNYGELLEYQLHDYERAKKQYELAIQNQPTFVQAYLNLAWLHLERFEDPQEAIRTLQKGLEQVEHWKLYAYQAYILYAYLDDHYDEAMALCEKALELSPRNHLVLTYMGQIHLLLGQKERAYERFQQALATGQLNHILVLEFCQLLIVEYRDFNQAIDLLKQAMDYFKDDAIYPCYLANLHANIGKIQEAREYIRIAEERPYKDQHALLLIGYLKAAVEQDPDDAMLYFEKVVEINPSNLNALSIVAFYKLFNERQIEEALRYFNQIIELNAPFYAAYFIAAQIYAEYYRDYQKALEIYNRINPDDLTPEVRAQLYFAIGRLYQTGFLDRQQALDYYEKAYETHPNKRLAAFLNRFYEENKTLIN
ncbi:MAG TPA: tetratricopeptide repeat protein [Haloplasmataceae bacterium]